MKRHPATAYSFETASRVAARGMRLIEAWLWSLPQTVGTENVEADPHYQKGDIDLLWFTERCPRGYSVEVKVDRFHHTGNFFFETHSNVERGTPGCFLYTEAALLFYLFVETRLLYILPMPATRDWFVERMEHYPVRDTRTPIGGGRFYTTRGRLVPRDEVMHSVAGARVVSLPERFP